MQTGPKLKLFAIYLLSTPLKCEISATQRISETLGKIKSQIKCVKNGIDSKAVAWENSMYMSIYYDPDIVMISLNPSQNESLLIESLWTEINHASSVKVGK